MLVVTGRRVKITPCEHQLLVSQSIRPQPEITVEDHFQPVMLEFYRR